MKTRIYIDGYNFYFGCLKGTSFKWLDPVSLIEILLVRSGAPESILDELAVKFFTAEISERAVSDRSSLNDQRSYHLALNNHCSNRLQTIKGNYSIDKTKFPKVEQDERGKEKEPRSSERVKIWKMEEKQSDVNVALEAVYDAVTDLTLEHIVFVTNDTDIIPALRKIQHHNELKRPTRASQNRSDYSDKKK
jgi:6-hydroxy-3-succinoylpyridine 3-monooxygenase